MDVGLVCDVCSSFNAMGSKICSACGAELSLDPPSEEAAAAPGTVPCPSCSNEVPEHHRFCGVCGHPMGGPVPAKAPRMETHDAAPEYHPPNVTQPRTAGAGRGNKAKTMFFSAIQAARAKLVLIKGDGLDGVTYTLAGEEHIAGRDGAALLFEEDPFLSPIHANFLYRDGKLVVRDESSENGVYIRIRGSHPVQINDRFLVGEQVLEVQETAGLDPEAEEDGTYFYTSQPRQAPFRLVQLLRGGDTGLAYHGDDDVVSLGREGNDINFPDDPFISGHHAQVSSAEGRLSLTDLGSKNGTFLRVNGESMLEHGDYVFMGQQLLRVEIV